MICHWLHLNPAEDMDEWSLQVGQAKWLEERYFIALGRTIHGSKRG